MKDENEMKELALFRFSLIAPVVSDTYRESSKMEYFRNVANGEIGEKLGTEKMTTFWMVVN